MEQTTRTAQQPQKKDRTGTWYSITTNRSVGMLVTKCVLMFVVPYMYLFVCGFIDSQLVRTGYAYRTEFVLFVFFSLMAMWIIGAVLAVMSIVKWCRRKNKK